MNPIKAIVSWLLGVASIFSLYTGAIAETQVTGAIRQASVSAKELEQGAQDRPNIVWLSMEDITPMMGCYGDKYARTPEF